MRLVSSTVKRARPLRRRRFNTLRPLVEAMRRRKPCVLSRLRTLGCQVRFVDMIYLLLSCTNSSVRSDRSCVLPVCCRDKAICSMLFTCLIRHLRRALWLRPIILSNCFAARRLHHHCYCYQCVLGHAPTSADTRVSKRHYTCQLFGLSNLPGVFGASLLGAASVVASSASRHVCVSKLDSQKLSKDWRTARSRGTISVDRVDVA